MKLARFGSGLAGALLLTAGALAQERPEALVKMYEARQRLETGEVEYSWEHPRTDPGWVVYYTSRFGGPDNLMINRGDKDGRVGVPPGREESPEMHALGARQTLMRDQQTWLNYQGEPGRAELYETDTPPENVLKLRTLGVCCLNSYDELDDVIWRDKVKQPSARVYHESVEGGLHVVSADTDYGRLTWWIDPLRGWSPVRATYERDGKLKWESRSTLKQYGDVWYPEKVVFLGGSSGIVMEVIEVQRAAFNQPDQPARLTPTDFGAEVGMAVDRHTSPDVPMGNLVWDGEKPIEILEFVEREAAGELKTGPSILREQARIMALQNAPINGAPAGLGARAASTTGPAPVEGADLTYLTRWQRYVREFVARHQLDDGQQQKARLILLQCEARAGVYLTRRKPDFERLEQRMASVETLEGDQRAAAERDILAQRDSLFAPINDIFENELKPRLDRLLTRAQRAKAKSGGEKSTGEP